LLNLYISHADGDQKYLEEFLAEIKPMQEKYNLRIWHNHPEPATVIPFPWSLLFFWYRPRSNNRLPYHYDLPNELAMADIYLFLTSQKSVNVDWIKDVEERAATERYNTLGNHYVRVFTIPVSASQWRIFSSLSIYPSLGPAGKAINQLPTSKEGWATVLDQLKPIIEVLSQNHLEKRKIEGLPLNPKPLPWNDTPPTLIPFPQWVGWAMLIAILFSTARAYDSQCTRKMAPGTIKRNPKPEEYRRENPVQPPVDVPFPPDTL
jgi:hypothetical protein